MINFNLLFKERAGAISKTECEDYKEAWTAVATLDLDEVKSKYNVQIETDNEPPYCDYETQPTWDGVKLVYK